MQKAYQCRLRAAATGWELDKKVRGELLTELETLSTVLRSTGKEMASSDAATDTFVKGALSSLRLNANMLSSRLKVRPEFPAIVVPLTAAYWPVKPY